MAKNAPTTTIKQVLDNLDRNRIAYQVELFLKNGGVIKQLKGYEFKPLNRNPCGWEIGSNGL